jgi:23S rRNA-/tRNA-specific pseudouridylate synthase
VQLQPIIIYEDAILLVCHKPAGLMVEPDRNNFPNITTGKKLP